MRIKKTSQTTPVQAEVVNDYSTSQVNVYSCDYVNGLITTGSNANGSWVKYPDGTMICSGIISKGTQNFTQVYYTSLYRSSTENMSITYPQTFIATPSCTLNPIGSAKWVILTAQGTTTTSPTFTVVAPQSMGNEEVIIDYVAVGKWK